MTESSPKPRQATFIKKKTFMLDGEVFSLYEVRWTGDNPWTDWMPENEFRELFPELIV